MKKLLIIALAVGTMITAYSITASTSEPRWKDGEFHPVDSTIFDAAKYEPESKTLTLLFRTGEVYAYEKVSRKTFYTFMRTLYKGSFFNAHIRRAYDYHYVGLAP